ncbi:MAG: rod shape-determining protein RodA [Verrucomicrobiae bacterium]|nr:rod shape-determining protein RodA [Verrucomicrobiae bacterium]
MIRRRKTREFFHELLADFRWGQLIAVLCLMTFSLLFIYSATVRSGEGVPDEVKKQGLWFALGLVGYFFASLLDYRWVCRKAWLLYAGTFALLIWVLLKGKKIYGARRWITFESFAIQPSEFAKLSVLLILCWYLGRRAGKLRDWRSLAVASLLAIVPAVLIHRQPDLGTAISIPALLFLLLFLAGASARFFGILALVALLASGLVGWETWRYTQFRHERSARVVSAEARYPSILHLKEYQLNRILGVVAPDELDQLNEGWNIRQSLIAIGSGRFSGKGWGKGDVTRGGYLPRTVSLNDFIFAVFAEESGFVGGVALLALYSVLLFSGARVAIRAGDTLGMLLAGGVTFLFFFHIFVNIGMALGLLPVVGVPLPLMSYGGSFVLVCLTALGLIQSVWLHRNPY